MAIGDINNDEYKDLIQIGCSWMTSNYCSGYLAKVYINNGTSFVESTSWESSLTPVNYGSIALGDINNDGYLDLALSGCINGGGSVSACINDDHSAVYINNGTSFVESNQWKGNIVNAWKSSFAFGDVNSDGKLDLVLSGVSMTAGSIVSRVYINNGTSFKENTAWEQELTGVYGSSATLVDIDNDRRLDLFLVGDSGSGYVAKVYINNGTSFVESSSWESNLLGVELASAVWGDFDNNGRMDLSLIGHTSSDEHRIYNNTGTSLIQINSQYETLIGIFEGTQTLGDYNNDGNLDIFASGEEQYSTLYLNTSAGYWEDPESQIFNTAYGPAAAWADVNNDGALDLILIGWDYFANWWKTAIYINNITTKNTVPSPPTTLNANYSNGILNLSWNAGSDVETPSAGLYYNLRVGTTPGGNQIVTGVYGGGDDNGYFGNMMQRRNILLNVNLSDAIYWSVQTIDTGLKAGAWATERILNISSGGQSQNQTNDTTAPNVTITSPANGSTSTSSSVGVSAGYNDFSNVTCMTRLDAGSYGSMTISDGFASYLFSSVSNGTHTLYVNCTDVYNNSALHSIFFTVSLPVTPPPSGGGGGGPIILPTNRTNTTGTNTTPITTSVSKIDIFPGEVKTIEPANIFVRHISIEVQNTVTNAKVDVTITEKPDEVEAPSGNVYSYIEITKTNLTNSDVRSATIDFSIGKAWLTENDINKSTITLNRYSDGWQRLDTVLIGENSTDIVYEAATPGFSLFAVTGEKNVIYVEPSDNSDYYLPAVIALIAFAMVGGYFYYRKPKKVVGSPVTENGSS